MISFYRPAVGDHESDAVDEAISEGTLSTGEIVTEFETEFSAFVGRNHAAAVSSGSTALELAFQASCLQPGDRILVSPFNCSAVLYSIQTAGLIPVFADIDPETYNLDPSSVREKLQTTEESIDGLLITHLYGQPCRMDALCSLADEFDLLTVEDFCQAPGAAYNDQSVGTFGQLSVCSFGATKPITAAEGGMVLCDNASLDETVRQQRNNNGVDVTPPPRSARLSDIHAAIGLSQLRRYSDTLQTKRRFAEIYRSQLPAAISPQHQIPDTEHVYHRFPVQTSERDRLGARLKKHGVETTRVIERPLFKFDSAPDVDTARFPATIAASNRGLHLPLHTTLTEDDIKTVADTVSMIVE